MDVKGSLNLLISSQDSTKVKLNLSPLSGFAESLDAKSLQFKYHPNLARAMGVIVEEEIKLKDPNRSWPVGTPLGVLRWRATSKDESLVPLSRALGTLCFRQKHVLTRRSVNCWPTPSGDGTCDVNIEYELETEAFDLINLAISIPLP